MDGTRLRMEDRVYYQRYAFEEFHRAIATLRSEARSGGSPILTHEEEVGLLLHYHQAMLQVVQFADLCAPCTHHVDLVQARANASALDLQRQQYANDPFHLDLLALQTFMQSCVERLKPLALLCDPCCAEIQQQIATLFYAIRNL